MIQRRNFLDQPAGFNDLRLDAQFTGIGKGKRAQIVDQVLQPHRLFADDLEIFTCGRQDSIVYGFRMAEDQT